MRQEIQKSSEMKFDGKLIKVTYDVASIGEKEAWREVVHHPGASAVVAVDSEGRIIMERQFRYALQDAVLEIPAGKLDAGEDPLVCAQRELEEETGLKANRWTSLGVIATSPGFCNEVIHLYLAQDLEQGEMNWDEDEYVEVERYTLKELLEKIGEEEIKDSKTLSALLLAMPYIRG